MLSPNIGNLFSATYPFLFYFYFFLLLFFFEQPFIKNATLEINKKNVLYILHRIGTSFDWII
jgi:hypothetical protein